MEGIHCNVNDVVVCARCLLVESALSLCLCFLLEVCERYKVLILENSSEFLVIGL